LQTEYGPLAYMTTALLLAKPPVFKPFTLALIQLGNIGANKSHNLNHAREMILKAANGESGSKKKPDLIVLPVLDVSPYFPNVYPSLLSGMF
jgi:omega-amidase